jgi:hypothetical protein
MGKGRSIRVSGSDRMRMISLGPGADTVTRCDAMRVLLRCCGGWRRSTKESARKEQALVNAFISLVVQRRRKVPRFCVPAARVSLGTTWWFRSRNMTRRTRFGVSDEPLVVIDMATSRFVDTRAPRQSSSIMITTIRQTNRSAPVRRARFQC